MISCAAVQKLERYGQLGLKRSSVDDYVQSSLKDSKRANLFALTHLDTWRECRDFICPAPAATGQPNEQVASTTGAVSLPRKEVAVSESLVYAMSFTAALVGEQCHRACRQAARTASQETTSGVPIFEAETPEKAWQDCVALMELLKDLTVTMHRQRARVWTQHSSASLTQAVAHYCSTLTDAFASVAALVSLASSSTLPGKLVSALSASVFSALTAAVRHLKRCAAHDPVDSLFHTRTLPAMVRQYLHKQQQQQNNNNSNNSNGKGKQGGGGGRASAAPTSQGQFSLDALAASLGVSASALQQLPPLVCLLLTTTVTSSSCAQVFDGCSLFQRLSLLYALVSLDTPVSAVSSPMSVRGAADEDGAAGPRSLLDEVPVNARTQMQTALCALLAPIACNRATRYVVYYRGDDVRLLQNNVRQPSEYAMHTFTTTAPIDPALVASLTGFLEVVHHTAVPVTVANANMRCALLVASWMASTPLFFHSFCTDPTWSAFAREQRRMTILNQMKERRERKQERRKRRRTQDDGEEDGKSASASVDDASDTASVASHHSVSSQLSHNSVSSLMSAGGGGGLLDTMSLASRQTSIGLLSLASRASMLSTLSKRSQASYLSFLSVLRPEPGTGGEGESTLEEPKLHESADGNTNLPLILLEELVLGLYAVMENYDVKVLDKFGLRELAWQCIGHMLALVQGSMHHRGRVAEASARDKEAAALSPLVTSIPTPLFNLGYDTRYNHGLGYEALGLLFAKVISPQLEGDTVESDAASAVARTASGQSRGDTAAAASDDDDEASVHSTAVSVGESESARPQTALGGAPRQTRGRPYVSVTEDAVALRVRVEAALSQCLATYEDVAPQVVDANLSTILRIAARASSLDTVVPTVSAHVDVSCSHIHVAFLAEITQRLGRGNQLPVLLDALLKPESSSPHGDEHAKPSTVSADAMSTSALRGVFAQPPVHAALSEACALAVDPENLLSHVIAYVASLTHTDDESESEQCDKSEAVLTRSPVYVLFLLQLVAALLEGVAPTSVTSAAVLERSTELELLLSTFLVERLAPLLNSTEASEEELATARDSWTFYATTTPAASAPEIVSRQLLLHTLYALYQCRQVTRRCLQDLGSSPVMPYLEMLEETLWQCQTQVRVLVGGHLDMEALEAMFGLAARTAVDGVTHLSMAPHLDAATLLRLLVVQRLRLARSVSTMLGVRAGPAGEARQMAHQVLDSLAGGGEDDATTAALRLANWISAEDWQSLCFYGKPKRVRQRLITLLRVSFAAQTTSGGGVRSTTEAAIGASITSAESPRLPVWLSRCLRVDDGAVLRALVTLLLTTDTDSVVAFLNAPIGSPGDDSDHRRRPDDVTAEARRLLVAVRALREIYLGAGHIPYWCSLLDTVIDWLQAWHKTYTKTHGAVSGFLDVSQVNEALLTSLLQLARDCLVLERRAAELCREALFEVTDTTATAATTPASAAPAAARTSAAQLCREAFTAALGVPVSISARIATTSRASHGDAEGADGEEVDMEAQEAAALRHAVGSLFSPRSRLTRLMWGVSCSAAVAEKVGTGASDSHETARTPLPLRETVVSLLAFVYQNALQSAQVWLRRHRQAMSKHDTPAREVDDASAFLGFRYVHEVVTQFIHRLADESDEEGDAIRESQRRRAREACGATLVRFLTVLDGKALVLPVAGGSTGRRTRAPAAAPADGQPAEKEEDTDAELKAKPVSSAGTTPKTAAEVMAELFQRWMLLLQTQLVVVLRGGEQSSEACQWVNALYGHLLDAFLACEKQTPRGWVTHRQTTVASGGGGSGVKRARGQNGTAADTATVLTTRTNHASDSASQFIEVLHHAGGTDKASAEFLALLASVFNTVDTTTDAAADAGDKANKRKGHKSPSDKPSLLARLVQSDATPRMVPDATEATSLSGVTTAWLLLKLHEVLLGEQTSSSSSSSSLAAPAVVSLQRALRAVLLGADSVDGATQAGSQSQGWSRRLASPCAHRAAVRRLEEELSTLAPTLRIMHANTAPAALHHYAHALLNDALPVTATAEGLDVWLGRCTSEEVKDETSAAEQAVPASASSAVARRVRGAGLLSSVADALLALSAVPGMRMVPLVYILKRVLWASTALKPPAGVPTRGAQGDKHRTLWATLLQLCALPSPALTRDNSFLDSAQWFVLQLLEEGARGVSVLAAESSHALGFEEVMLVLRLLTQTWLRAGVFWRSPALLPNMVASLFEVVMRGVQAQRFPPHTVLNALASFLFQLVKDVELRRRQRGGGTDEDGDVEDASQTKVKGDDDGVQAAHKHARREPGAAAAKGDSGARAETKLGQQDQAQQASAALGVASTSTQYLSLAAATAAVFEVAQSYVSVFTTYSNDTDYIASDLLKALSRVHLPRKVAPPIAYRAGTRIVNPGLAAHTYSDLTFTAVGSEESKSLLRQAALRIEEEQEDLVDDTTRAWQKESGTVHARLGAQRSIFRVAE